MKLIARLMSEHILKRSLRSRHKIRRLLSGAGLAIFFALLQACVHSPTTTLPALSREESSWLGERIFANECNLKTACLTSWNTGEDFPSLGIGHFIWYRENQREVFVESFPQLLEFYDAQGVALPGWITGLERRDSPWQTREEFQMDFDSPRMQELRNFLDATRHVQVGFIIRRMHASLPSLKATSARPQAVEQLFLEISRSDSPLGMYALIDYINFKGEGISTAERYQGEGWGLLQVLEHVLDTREPGPLLPQFTRAASQVLTRRVENSPPERGEQRWLVGWNNRVASYSAQP
ncbi:MAG: hypothetical protein Q7U82_13390 [Gammaproteobacteria bacterium]|nr:hypothetical protein [Gammaproteobacteria bacterium]